MQTLSIELIELTVTVNLYGRQHLHMMLYDIYKESPHLFGIMPVALNPHHTTSNVYFKE